MGNKAISLYREHNADRVVAEVNNGGEMVENTLRMVDRNVAFTAVHASRGKVIRAEPVAARYERASRPRLACRLVPKARRSDVRLHDRL